jgi:hypothetical protein
VSTTVCSLAIVFLSRDLAGCLSLDLWTSFGFCGSRVSLAVSFHDLSFVLRPFSQLQWELSTVFSHDFISFSIPLREREC